MFLEHHHDHLVNYHFWLALISILIFWLIFWISCILCRQLFYFWIPFASNHSEVMISCFEKWFLCFLLRVAYSARGFILISQSSLWWDFSMWDFSMCISHVWTYKDFTKHVQLILGTPNLSWQLWRSQKNYYSVLNL